MPSDRIWYNASQNFDLRNVFEDSGTLAANVGIPDWVLIGPAFFDGFPNFPDTPFSWQLNLGKTYNLPGGLENTLEVARLALHAVGPRLESFEIGNEPDMFPRFGHRKEGYTMEEYVKDGISTRLLAAKEC